VLEQVKENLNNPKKLEEIRKKNVGKVDFNSLVH
jgi:hypothetical protein